MNYNLVITQPAEKDLADILHYISKDLSAPKAANDLLDDILKCYDNISLNPLMYALCDNDRLKSKKYRKKRESFMMRDLILIVDIVNSQDLKQLLKSWKKCFLIFQIRDIFHTLLLLLMAKMI